MLWVTLNFPKWPWDLDSQALVLRNICYQQNQFLMTVCFPIFFFGEHRNMNICITYIILHNHQPTPPPPPPKKKWNKIKFKKKKKRLYENNMHTGYMFLGTFSVIWSKVLVLTDMKGIQFQFGLMYILTVYIYMCVCVCVCDLTKMENINSKRPTGWDERSVTRRTLSLWSIPCGFAKCFWVQFFGSKSNNIERISFKLLKPVCLPWEKD
jgi:hypothetical protein